MINKGAGFANGELSQAMIRAQMRVLDDSFAGALAGRRGDSSFSSPA